MIVSLVQHERLKQQALQEQAPKLWALLNCPFECRTPAWVVTEKWQRQALAELRRLLPNLTPERRTLDTPPSPG